MKLLKVIKLMIAVINKWIVINKANKNKCNKIIKGNMT